MEEFPDMGDEIKEIARVRKLKNDAARIHVDNLQPINRRASLELLNTTPKPKPPEVIEIQKAKSTEPLSPRRERRITGVNILPNIQKENNRKIWKEAIKQDQEIRNESLWTAVTKAFKESETQDDEAKPILQKRNKTKIINSLASNLLKGDFGMIMNSKLAIGTTDLNKPIHLDSSDKEQPNKLQFLPWRRDPKIFMSTLLNSSYAEAALGPSDSSSDSSSNSSESLQSFDGYSGGLFSDFALLEEDVEKGLDDSKNMMKSIESKQTSIINMLEDIVNKLQID